MIEAYGTGLGKIIKAYESTSVKPGISTTKNSFKIILPNVNTQYENKAISIPTKKVSAKPAPEMDTKEKQVLNYLKNHDSITRPDVEKVLGISASTASRLIKKMVKSGLLVQHGRARNVNYTIAE